MTPEITITLTYPYRLPIVLSLEEAREVWMQLNSLFSPTTVNNHVDLKSLGGNGYEAHGLISEAAMRLKGVIDSSPAGRIEAAMNAEMFDSFVEHTEVKQPLTEESQKTLRDKAEHPCKGLGCWCMESRLEDRQPNGICDDPTIPVDRW